ncbi:MAG TPA: putative Fe-S cluster assembly protein SufT [Verrucomicrobia subdivision 6 bacterium]|jgi:probable FeS assembly SUF system protein SufT|uniref:FeS assembly SUF system protein SufT n=3 Tax=Verrucomicrobia subdivision 6 TaxID=134627 RepID=A0A0R2X9S6_9BACT|nr:MAG: FeS assembly SUF system protein SufT [Verrucomicrobia subdivision 6 bacterium BACL9 MAG-120507-bin52]KRP32810.1 MAG: FeS assembly SUF system protein SufT [Verrucomicrobia subdivision 6 bacterium BACL9 MAG-120820-bin42]KRP33715.1 MAG: FeS assembly SUF system protein SufT [Verrucomicrobia subdivision 6 bacterium BACL9 MAG-120924-bin69]MDA0858552.1 putative Fe-S cluster assembly protein SufT [Verrucomicrobiota bacterium]HBZ84565.1 putative Fe-S cluster assembly protein SufT [Verrucomicrobi
MSDEIQLKREVEATAIPAGTKKRLSQGTAVVVTQDLGGTFTIHATAEGGLFRIEGKDADALGRKVTETGVIDSNKEAGEEDVWGVLKTCYDPEIPVNIVDLGLIYSMELKKTDAGGKRAEVKMTLTAQGCGMGPSIAADARQKILSLSGIQEAQVDVVWEPPWGPQMITPDGRKKLGMD